MWLKNTLEWHFKSFTIMNWSDLVFQSIPPRNWSVWVWLAAIKDLVPRSSTKWVLMRTKQLSTAARWYCCVYAHVQGSYNKRQQQFIHSVQEKEKNLWRGDCPNPKKLKKGCFWWGCREYFFSLHSHTRIFHSRELKNEMTIQCKRSMLKDSYSIDKDAL